MIDLPRRLFRRRARRAGNTRSEGFGEVEEARRELGPAAVRGFVFYHAQDVDRAVTGDDLYLAFGAFDGSKEEAALVAGRIIARLRECGLVAHWDGDVDTRILVRPIRWPKRTPGPA